MNGTEDRPEPPRKGRRRYGRVLGVRAIATFLAGAMAAAFIGGFITFVARLPTVEITLKDNADGIVVLTGGSSRVQDALDLLAEGRGRRLLISGVYPRNSTGDLSRSLPDYQRLIACCVDLDHYATNTIGNAIETRRWAREKGFTSLVVVTSNYHMPRALTELSFRMPDVKLIAYPVIGEGWRTDSSWSSGARARLLLTEYSKLVVAELRCRLQALGVLGETAFASTEVPRERPETASVR